MLEQRKGKGATLKALTSIGFPFHGVRAEGANLPDVNPDQPDSGLVSNVWQRATEIRNPNRTLPTRTPSQQTQDASEGKEYRDYGLLSGDTDVVNGKRYSVTSNQAFFRRELTGLYFDTLGYPWAVDMTQVFFDADNDTLSGPVTFRRTFTVASGLESTEETVNISLSPAGLATIGPSDETLRSANISGGATQIADQKTDGSQFLLVPESFFRTRTILKITADINFMRPYAVWTLDISDTVANGYPRSGGISFSVQPAVYKSLSQIRSDATIADTQSSTIGDYTFIKNFDNGSGGNFNVADGGIGDKNETENHLDSITDPDFNRNKSFVRVPASGNQQTTYQILNRLLFVCYDNDAIVEFSQDFDLTAQQNFTSSLNGGSKDTGSDETGTWDDSASRTGNLDIVVRIRRNGIIVTSRTASYSHSGSGSSGSEISDSGSDSADANYDGVVTRSENNPLSGTGDAAEFRGVDFAQGFFADQHWNLEGFVNDFAGISRDPMEFVLNHFFPKNPDDTAKLYPGDMGAEFEFTTFIPCLASSNKTVFIGLWTFNLKNNSFSLKPIGSGDAAVGDVVSPQSTQSGPGSQLITNAEVPNDANLLGHPFFFHGTPTAWQPVTGQWAIANWLPAKNRFEHLIFV